MTELLRDPFDPRRDGTEPVDDAAVPLERRAPLNVIATVADLLQEASDQGFRLDVEKDRHHIAQAAVAAAITEMKAQGVVWDS